MLLAAQAPAIPFFDYPRTFVSEEDDLMEIIRRVGRRGAFIMQAELESFEQHLAGYVGVRWALGVGNATDALCLAVRAAGLGAGDEVILCTHTMIATAIGVHWSGATPVPVDCGDDHLIDPEAVEQAITPRTRAILVTHLNGRTCDMGKLSQIAASHDLLILEDAAQALGSRFEGRMAGSFGAVSAISFYPAKLLGCLGDGGAVLTSDEAIYKRLRRLRDFGRDESGEVVEWGFNTRLDNIQAAILDYRLTKYGEVIRHRRNLARRYEAGLKDVSELVLPPGPDDAGPHFDVYQNYEVEAENRDQLRSYLAAAGIGTLVQWGGRAIHHCRKLGFTEELPRTDRRFQRMLMLPMNNFVSAEDADRVCEWIRRFYGYRS